MFACLHCRIGRRNWQPLAQAARRVVACLALVAAALLLSLPAPDVETSSSKEVSCVARTIRLTKTSGCLLDRDGEVALAAPADDTAPRAGTAAQARCLPAGLALSLGLNSPLRL